MTDWSDMQPAEFDGRLATAKQRRAIAEAPSTLFPRLLPDVAPKPTKPAAPELDGQGSLLGGEE